MMAEARALGDINWLQSGIRILGLQNSAITLTFSLVFTILGTFRVFKNKDVNKTLKWWGLSLIFLSTHFVIYALFVISLGFYPALLYAEIWLIPLISIGTYFFINSK